MGIRGCKKRRRLNLNPLDDPNPLYDPNPYDEEEEIVNPFSTDGGRVPAPSGPVEVGQRLDDTVDIPLDTMNDSSQKQIELADTEMAESYNVISDLISHLSDTKFKVISDLVGKAGPWKATTSLFELLFTWRLIRPDTIDIPRMQEKNDCWIYALSRGHRALIKKLGLRRDPVTPEQLMEGVNARYVRKDGSLDNFDHVVNYMKQSHGIDMKIHRGKGYEDYEEFELLLKNLLVKGPVVVCIDFFPSIRDFNGSGVYVPSENVLQVRKFEKFKKHTLLATGHGIEVRGNEFIEFLEVQDSYGEIWGVNGFIRYAFHQQLITEIIELQVEDAYTATKGESPQHHSTSSESEFEGCYQEGLIAMSNLHKDITKDDLFGFFENVGKVDEVVINPPLEDDGKGGEMKEGLVKFTSNRVMKMALKLKGKLLLGRPIYLAPQGNGRRILFISGYNKDLSEDDIQQQITHHFRACGTILKFFFPKNSDTGSHLGFCYVLCDNMEDINLTCMEGSEIRVRDATLKTRVLRAKMG